MKKFIKSVLMNVAPELTTSLISAKSRAHSHRVIREWGCVPIREKLLERLGTDVIAGPFQGLRLTPMTYAEQFGPYLLGVYESELDDAWTIVFRSNYTQIVDIGAKFGYYAVGLAKRYPHADVIAFDTDWWARRAIREMMAANQTPNVKIKGFCTRGWLTQNIRDGAFVISDCEGFEGFLFNDEVIAALKATTLIIETHDFSVPGVSRRLHEGFSETHVVKTIGLESLRRKPEVDLSFLASDRERELATQEVRPAQVWLMCLPKGGPNSVLIAS